MPRVQLGRLSAVYSLSAVIPEYISISFCLFFGNCIVVFLRDRSKQGPGDPAHDQLWCQMNLPPSASASRREGGGDAVPGGSLDRTRFLVCEVDASFAHRLRAVCAAGGVAFFAVVYREEEGKSHKPTG